MQRLIVAEERKCGQLGEVKQIEAVLKSVGSISNLEF